MTTANARPRDRSPRPSPTSRPYPKPHAGGEGAEARTKELVIIDWSGELEKIWATLILASTAAASGDTTRSS